jgi:hypothetical protein
MVNFSEQRNPYKGNPPHPWVRLRFREPEGSLVELELLVDTGNPLSIILGLEFMARLNCHKAEELTTNFGILRGFWLELATPELGLNELMLGYGSDAILAAAHTSSSDFAGMVGLPLLRLLEYGGNADSFWVRRPGGPS